MSLLAAEQAVCDIERRMKVSESAGLKAERTHQTLLLHIALCGETLLDLCGQILRAGFTVSYPQAIKCFFRRLMILSIGEQ